MAFCALLFSKNTETNAAMATACESTGIRVEVCSDIFTAIEKGKTQAFSCVIADWAEQPEASFLLKRARESAPNRDTLAIAIVDRDPKPAELRDNRLDFLVYRPISVGEAEAVLAKACQQMQPVSVEDANAEASPGQTDASSQGPSTASSGADAPEPSPQDSPAGFPEANAADGNGEIASDEGEDEPQGRSHTSVFRGACAAVLVLTAAFCLWRSREGIEYLLLTPEGSFRVLRESVAALFYQNQTGALPVGSAGSDAHQDAYFSRARQFQCQANAAGGGGNRVCAGRTPAFTKGSGLSAARAVF